MLTATWDNNFPIPGNSYSQSFIVTNQGTITETNILGGYNTDGQLFGATFIPSANYGLSSTNWYTTTAGSGLSLAPGASQQFYVNYTVPTYIPLGTNVLFKDSVAYQTPMSNWLTDYSPWNNVNYFSTTVVSSYDPNFKEVNPKGIGEYGIITYADSNLQYMVHFQNTGTSAAQNITVIDTLDPNLDFTTLTPIYESAPCKISISPTGIATFTFSNINLPTVNYYNVASSNAMFTYSIKTRPGLPVGTQFKNSASIYFDYNAPIKTNTTLNTLMAVTKIPELAVSNNFFTIYPNPTNSNFNMVVNSNTTCTAQMNITDLAGRQLITKSLNLQQGNQTITTSTNQLASGIYFVTLSMNGNVQTQKLVVIR